MNCRILYLVGQLGLGGLERQLFYLLQTMDRERCRPGIVVWNFRNDDNYVLPIQRLGVPFFFLPQSRLSLVKLIAFRRLVIGLKPEIVHSYSFYTNFAAWYAACANNVTPLGSMRSSFLEERRDPGMVLGRLSAVCPPGHICNSQTGKISAERDGGIFKPRRIYVVRNGLDLKLFRPSPFPEKLPTILAVGRPSPEKRWDRLLRCVAAVARKGLTFRVRLAGDGPMLGQLKEQANRLGVGGIVEFLGFQKDIPSLLKDSTFLVHTSDVEGCPNVIMEAMACGRPVLATDAGDIPFMVEDQTSGFIVSRQDEQTLIARMATLIVDGTLCRRMGEAGRAKAEKEYGLDRLVSETQAAYRAEGWKD